VEISGASPRVDLVLDWSVGGAGLLSRRPVPPGDAMEVGVPMVDGVLSQRSYRVRGCRAVCEGLYRIAAAVEPLR
jgi:hypothetical protein